MKPVWPSIALLAFAIAGCTGSGTPVLNLPAPTPVPTLPGVAAIGYAADVVTNTGGIGITPSISINEYATGTTSAIQTFLQDVGIALRFDPSGTLWSDQVGEFVGYGPDGSKAGTIFGTGQLLWFDVRGNLYTSGRVEGEGVGVYLVGLNDEVESERFIQTTGLPCSVAADRAGNVYLSTCVAMRTGRSYSNVMMYGPAANGATTPALTSVVASGPVTIDPSGNVYAVMNGVVGEWAGSFTTGPPTRTITIGQGMNIFDLAVDRAGNVYAIGRASSALTGTATTLFFAPSGAGVATALQTGLIEYIAAPIQ